MGYQTDFLGSISVEPSLKNKQRDILEGIYQGTYKPGNLPDELQYDHCKWVVAETLDENEKLQSCIHFDFMGNFYNAELWMKFLIENYLQDYNCNGIIEARGDDHEDHWYLIVENNKVYTAPVIQSIGEKTAV